MPTAHPTLGIFGGIFNVEGKILVKRRGPDESMPGDWDLPGGGIEVDSILKAFDERVIGEELLREIEEETGMIFPAIQPMPALYPAVLKGGGDLALATILGVTDQEPAIGEWRFISPSDLERLAMGPEGNRLVSGRGKRMYRLILRMFASRDCPNLAYRGLARVMLKKLQEEQ
jgi:8-oxo-dGTP pyrophosphatase MutT (NUDIX family)